MNGLLGLSRIIDGVNKVFAMAASWLVLGSCMVSALNAGIRYLFSISSNGWLEIQWQMFAGIFLLGAAYVLKLNEHVRVDLFYGSARPRTRLWIDIFGFIFFYFPATIIIFLYAWPFFIASFESGEHSSNAGGLILWPVKALLPLGFILLIFQGISEFIKRIAALKGDVALNTHYEKPLQ